LRLGCGARPHPHTPQNPNPQSPIPIYIPKRYSNSLNKYKNKVFI